MIELPEAQTVARQMNDTFLNKTVSNVLTAQTPHGFAFYNGNASVLLGKTMTATRAYGGRVEMEAEDVRFTFNDGANARLVKPGQKLPAKHQFLLSFNDGSHLVFTVSMYAGFTVRHKDDEEDFYARQSKICPPPLSDAFNFPYFKC